MKWSYGYNTTFGDGKVCDYCKIFAQYAFLPSLMPQNEAPHRKCMNRECRCMTALVGNAENPKGINKKIIKLLKRNGGFVRLAEVEKIIDAVDEERNVLINESQKLVDRYHEIQATEKDDPARAVEKYIQLVKKYSDPDVFRVAESYFIGACDRISLLSKKSNPDAAVLYLKRALSGQYKLTKGDKVKLQKRLDTLQ